MRKEMNKLVIGCGYLGSRVAKVWHAQGHKVFAATRDRDRAESFRQAGWEPIVCDVTEPASLRTLPRVDAVLYAVGLDRSSGLSMRAVYVAGLANVLDHLPAPDKFLHVSSTSVYGQSSGEEVTEDSPTEPAEENGRIVLEAEQTLREKFPPAVIMRFAGIYGPNRGLRRKQIEAGEPIVCDPDIWLNLIHVEDGVAAVLAAEEKAPPGTLWNICDDCPVKRGDFYGFMADLLHVPLRLVAPTEAEKQAAAHQANRRISNRNMRQRLGVELKYPSHVEGLTAD
jgi:nucleoside-diphosphate-sugar epimerase